MRGLESDESLLFGNVVPTGSGAQHPQDGVEHLARVGPGPSPVHLARRRRWQEWFYLGPLGIGQRLEHSLQFIILEKGSCYYLLLPDAVR